MSNIEPKQRGRGGRGDRPSDNEPSTSSGKRQREESNDGESKRHASGKPRAPSRRRQEQQIIHTRPHDNETSHNPEEVEKMKGSSFVTLEANFFALKSRLHNLEWAIYKYHVTFEPECVLKRLQFALLAQHKKEIGGYLFDGAQIFAIRKLHGEDNTVVFTSRTRDDQVYSVKLTFTRIVLMTDQESLQVLNLILRRNMSGLNLQVVRRNYYDPQNMATLPSQFRIQLWPGYETSIRYHNMGILLNCDVAHKIMRTDTVHDLMREVYQSNRENFKNAFKERVLGLTVLTLYTNKSNENKTYKIHDVDFDKTPLSTFKKNETEITIKDYYAQRQIVIKDDGQPLLISQPREKDLRGNRSNEERQPIWLVPELCKITGLDERQRNNMDLKRALKQYTQMEPRTRRTRLLDFNQRIQTSDENARIKEEWGLEVQRDLVKVKAYCLPRRTLLFAKGEVPLEVNRASWERECGKSRHTLHAPKDISRWMAIYPRSMEKEMRRFIQTMQRFAHAMDLNVAEPRHKVVESDKQMIHEIAGIADLNPRMLLFGTTTNSRKNSDLYSSIKKICYADYAIPSQVVTRHILNSQPNKYDSVATKVIIQMQTKIGGAPWVANTPKPTKYFMTIGFDVVKDSSNRNVTYGCLVATTDLGEKPSFFSSVSKIDGMDCSRELVINVTKALNAFEEKNQQLPDTIFFYRGGVGDGDLLYVRDVELNHLTTALQNRYAQREKEFKMAYIIVSKRINTRFFQKNGTDVKNPDPGTVIDNTVTLKERYEFFLVSQTCNQGTISPTNYNVIYDTTQLTPAKIQTWTYIQSHMYYNWYGTTRIPAVLQYANKLGFLVSNYMHRTPHTDLSDKLFFL